MANTKHSVGREIIIDRLLHQRRGYSLYEMLETVNQKLELNGFKHVTLNTIRNDINDLRYLYKQKIEVEVRNRKNYYRYADPDTTIFKNVLTYGEMQHIHSALMCIRFYDHVQGTLIYEQLSNRLTDLLGMDKATDPILIYEKAPKNNELRRFKALYEHIDTKTPADITIIHPKDKSKKDILVHPYYLLLRDSGWYLLCRDATNDIPAEIPISRISHLKSREDIEFLPNKDFPLQNFYAHLANQQ